LFTSYFSRSSTMDVFPTMGRHIFWLAMQVLSTH
jgi:hypothetical protein